MVEPVEEVIQLVRPLHCPHCSSGLCVEAFEGLHTFPDLLDVFFQLLLHFPPEAVLSFPHTVFHLLLCCLDGLPPLCS